MVHIRRKYIDSHWGIFIAKGILALLFGWISLFNSGGGVNFLLAIISVFLLCLSIIEFVNSIHRAHSASGWGVSIAIALVDAIVAVILLLTLDANIAVPFITLACYTILRGICEILIAFRTTVDPTDRFIWLISGVYGCIMGIVILNSGHLASTTFIRFFGAYLLVVSVCNLIYGVDNRKQQLEDSAARSAAIKSARAVQSFSLAKKRSRKSAKKSSPKS